MLDSNLEVKTLEVVGSTPTRCLFLLRNKSVVFLKVLLCQLQSEIIPSCSAKCAQDGIKKFFLTADYVFLLEHKANLDGTLLVFRFNGNSPYSDLQQS